MTLGLDCQALFFSTGVRRTLLRMKVLIAALLTVAALPLLAGDFCVVVCDASARRPRRMCPSPTFRTSAEIAADFRLIAGGGAPSWPYGAFGNGMFQFCSAAERKQLIETAIAVIPGAVKSRRRDLADFVCMAGSKQQCRTARRQLRDAR